MTEYLRGKLAERGTDKGATFMQDGFDRWAQSTEPARMGQMEKMPSEPMPEGRGGAMDVATAKKYLQEMHGKLKGQMEKIPSGKGMVNFGLGIEVNVPDQIIDAVKYAKKLADFVKMVGNKLPEINRDIQENIIDQPGDYSPETIADSKELLKLLQSLVGYVKVINNVLAYAQYIPTGSGRRRKSHKVKFGGAATTLETINSWIKYVTQAASTLYNYVSWFGKKAKTLKTILSLDSLQPTGKQILDALKPIYDLLGLVGMGFESAVMGAFEPRLPSFGQQMKRAELPMFGQETKRAEELPMFGQQTKRSNQEVNREISRLDELMMSNEFLTMPQQDKLKIKRRLQELMGVKAEEPTGMGKCKCKPKKRGGIAAAGPASSNFMPGRSAAMPFQRVTPETFQAFQPVEPPKPSGMGRKKSDRGAIVSKIMREKGLSLPQASKYVKEHGLYGKPKPKRGGFYTGANGKLCSTDDYINHTEGC